MRMCRWAVEFFIFIFLFYIIIIIWGKNVVMWLWVLNKWKYVKNTDLHDSLVLILRNLCFNLEVFEKSWQMEESEEGWITANNIILYFRIYCTIRTLLFAKSFFFLLTYQVSKLIGIKKGALFKFYLLNKLETMHITPPPQKKKKKKKTVAYKFCQGKSGWLVSWRF